MANIEKTAHEFAKPTNVRIKHAAKENGINKEDERKMQQETRREEIKLIVYA